MCTTSFAEFARIEAYLSKFLGGEVFVSEEYFENGIAVVYLNNPRKRNAMTGSMMVQLRNCIQKLEQWKEGKAVILCGKGTNFCSGADLEFVKASGTPEEATMMSTWMQDSLKRLQRLPMVTVCLIQGPTLGGGAEISIFCDHIVAAEDVSFGFVQGKMGIITAWGGGTRLVQKLGQRKALELFLTSKVLNAEECVEFGVADFTVSVGDAFERTLEWTKRCIEHSSSVVECFERVVKSETKSDKSEKAVDFQKHFLEKQG